MQYSRVSNHGSFSHGGARDDAGQVGRQEQRRVSNVIVVQVLQHGTKIGPSSSEDGDGVGLGFEVREEGEAEMRKGFDVCT